MKKFDAAIVEHKKRDSSGNVYHMIRVYEKTNYGGDVTDVITGWGTTDGRQELREAGYNPDSGAVITGLGEIPARAFNEHKKRLTNALRKSNPAPRKKKAPAKKKTDGRTVRGVSSPSKVTGLPPSPRLKRRRKKNATSGKEGFYANPKKRATNMRTFYAIEFTFTGGKKYWFVKTEKGAAILDDAKSKARLYATKNGAMSAATKVGHGLRNSGLISAAVHDVKK